MATRASLNLGGNPKSTEPVPEWVAQNLQLLDTDGRGEIEEDELEQLCEDMATLKRRKKKNSAKINLRLFSVYTRDVLSEWDKSGRGMITAEDLQQAAVAQKKMENSNRTLKILLFGSLLLVIILGCVNFGMSLAAFQLAKDYTPSATGVLVDRAGQTVQTESSQIDVDELGAAVVKGTRNAIATRRALSTSPLSSLTQDANLEELKQLKHPLLGSAEVLSVSRVVTPQSKCGSVVHIYTHIGRLTLDEFDIYVSQEMDAVEGHRRALGV
jgi:hypothetical protein